MRSMIRVNLKSVCVLLVSSFLLIVTAQGAVEGREENVERTCPLPEHPRPDFVRSEWCNLNGYWSFRFDAENTGVQQQWFHDTSSFSQQILVPFSWGAPLSGVEDKADIGWYARAIQISQSWAGKRVFLVIGASDWETSAWLDGKLLGTHRGGYTPFEFELTSHALPGNQHLLVLRVEDTPHRFKLEGKQGYGPARGIWQTPYLEARGIVSCETVHFTPDVVNEKVKVNVTLLEAAPRNLTLRVEFDAKLSLRPTIVGIPEGAAEKSFEIPILNPRLWSLEDPFLYETVVSLTGDGLIEDRVKTYFGMRDISIAPFPGKGYPYVALNGKPIYLQMALDQAYHPDGFYTFPTDEFMRNEILRTARLGLNGIRIHVKVGIPRKLYWADRLGILVMADVPNSWGEPTNEMRAETETALRGMIRRDYNHPAIFSWVLFNETWGLRFEEDGYSENVRQWVSSTYDLAKALDPSRLVEDNSANRGDHVVTDINSWHAYRPGRGWKEHLGEVSSKTFPGSAWNFVKGREQSGQPLLNSECGNVWGYEGSTGDVDWSWDYHIMINEFRRHPKIGGWLYTEHHDVINEWNGYFRYDRSRKFPGFGELAEGMSIRDLHAPVYVSTGSELCREVPVGAELEVPLWISVLETDLPVDGRLRLKSKLWGWDQLGQKRFFSESDRMVAAEAWTSEELAPMQLKMPDEAALAVLSLSLEDRMGVPLHRNFTTFLVTDGISARDQIRYLDSQRVRLLRFTPDSFTDATWSERHWEVMKGLKVNGAGHGFFEYRIPWPRALKVADIQEALFVIELSAKELYAKDRSERAELEGNYMRGGGVNDRSLNSNSYPMTDEETYPSTVRVRVNDTVVGVVFLEDDPADHRGVLSWHSQLDNGYLQEAGSYGYLTRLAIKPGVLQTAASAGKMVIRLEVDSSSSGGVAIYGERFGRYPLDPTVAFVLKQ